MTAALLQRRRPIHASAASVVRCSNATVGLAVVFDAASHSYLVAKLSTGDDRHANADAAVTIAQATRNQLFEPDISRKGLDAAVLPVTAVSGSLSVPSIVTDTCHAFRAHSHHWDRRRTRVVAATAWPAAGTPSGTGDPEFATILPDTKPRRKQPTAWHHGRAAVPGKTGVLSGRFPARNLTLRSPSVTSFQDFVRLTSAWHRLGRSRSRRTNAAGLRTGVSSTTKSLRRNLRHSSLRVVVGGRSMSAITTPVRRAVPALRLP